MNPKYIVLVTDITILLISKTPVYGLILDLCWKIELWKGNDASGSTKAENFLTSLRNYLLLKIGYSMEFVN
jgi:hypothetical protein